MRNKNQEEDLRMIRSIFFYFRFSLTSSYAMDIIHFHHLVAYWNVFYLFKWKFKIYNSSAQYVIHEFNHILFNLSWDVEYTNHIFEHVHITYLPRKTNRTRVLYHARNTHTRARSGHFTYHFHNLVRNVSKLFLPFFFLFGVTYSEDEKE